MAKDNHRDTRFFFDPNFPTSLNEKLYETWIEKSCLGYATEVFVAEIESEVVGYITCNTLQAGRGEIGLCGVATHHQGKGLGQILVNASLSLVCPTGRDLRYRRHSGPQLPSPTFVPTMRISDKISSPMVSPVVLMSTKLHDPVSAITKAAKEYLTSSNADARQRFEMGLVSLPEVNS